MEPFDFMADLFETIEEFGGFGWVIVGYICFALCLIFGSVFFFIYQGIKQAYF